MHDLWCVVCVCGPCDSCPKGEDELEDEFSRWACQGGGGEPTGAGAHAEIALLAYTVQLMLQVIDIPAGRILRRGGDVSFHLMPE